MSSIQGRTRVPHRDLDRESNKPGELTTYTMSPEELAALRARTGAPIVGRSRENNRPIELKTKPVKPKPVGAKPLQQKADATVKPAHKVKNEPDKTHILCQIAEGNSIASIERSNGMNPGFLHYCLRKWRWVGMTPFKARAVLNGDMKIEEVKNVSAKVEKVYSQKEVEEIIKRFTLLDEEKDATIKELIKDRDEWKDSANGWERDWVNVEKELENWKKIATEFQALAKTATHEAISAVAASDMVNSPAHYTAGGIEVIDFIIAKLTPEEFTGYCKGNIIKYIARANLKGGIEDLRKCRWYVERLLASSE